MKNVRSKLPTDGPLRVRVALKSGNRKTGPIPVTMTSAETCPPSCSWYGAGCYAENWMVAHHWKSTTKNGVDWDAFLEIVRAMPEGQIWRHNEAGDLPGKGERLDFPMFVKLVNANRGRRGFTYTHKPLTLNSTLAAFRYAREQGFTVNLSADTLEQADELYDVGVAPVCVVLELDTRRGVKTPKGRTVTICPAETDGLTCEECRLCAVPTRKAIVGFRPHGDLKFIVSERAAKRPNKQLPLLPPG